MDNIFILALIAAILSFIFTPLVKKIAIYFNIMDIPKDNRRIHKKPIPLMGGLAIYMAFAISIMVKKGHLSLEEIGIISGATIITLGGILDDKYDLKPWKKLLFQLTATLCLILTKVYISGITNPFNDSSNFLQIGYYLYIPITILWVIGITNAINLIDGLDGLAAGITFISTITILIIAVLISGRGEAALLSAIFAGAVLGFLPYNFNPASIFMGDTGAQLLGFLLAAISMEGAIKSAAAFAIAVPILALGLPIYDTLFAIIRRRVNGMPMMQGDRGHLHHRLLDMGFSQKKAVIIMYLISSVLGGFAILAMVISNRMSFLLLGSVIILFILLAWKYGFFKHLD